MKSRGHGDAMAELYRKDPALALEVINGILEDGDQKAASSPAPSMQACKYIAMFSQKKDIERTKAMAQELRNEQDQDPSV